MCWKSVTAIFLTVAAVISTTRQADADTVGLEDPIPQAIHPHKAFSIKLDIVAAGLAAPNWGTFAPGDSDDRLFVTDQGGILWAIDLNTGDKTVFLDVSDRIVVQHESGLLGVAFHPDYAMNGLLYTYTSEPATEPPDFPSGTTANHQSLITEWQVLDPPDPTVVVDADSDRVLLRIDQPQANHNGGALNFGPDGMLFISLGDGGNRDDQGDGHGSLGNGQDPSTVLGTILRIDPDGSNSDNGEYGIPDDNPFIDVSGFVPEIFAFGFRNPFRFSFDAETGDLYVGDVGQDDIEEVDVVAAGGNYGWNLKEGTFCFNPNGDDPGFVTECASGEMLSNLIDPVAQYDHDEGVAIIGGFIYRGTRIETLRGRYVFGDFTRTFDNDGRLFFLSNDKIRELQLVGQGALGLSLLGFGQDASGELYVLGNETHGIPSGDTGVVLRISPDTDDVIVDFGPGFGLWVRMNDSEWVKLHDLSPESMVTGDMDGNGQDEVIVDFGPGFGLWVRLNDSTWVKLQDLSPEGMVTGDMDGNGQDEVIVDFGPGFGLWVRLNNTSWVKLQDISPETMATGDMDGN